MLDLAEQREWRQRSSMKEPRRDFGCGVKDGKIYGFGGDCRGICPISLTSVRGSYTSHARTMKYKRCPERVTVFGEEMLVHGGLVFPNDDSGYDASYLAFASVRFLEVYHPGKDEWRLVKRSKYMGLQRLFMMEGKLCKRGPSGSIVSNSDIDEHNWQDLKKVSLDVVGSIFPPLRLHAIHAVNDEILATVGGVFGSHEEIFLLQSKWFGS